MRQLKRVIAILLVLSFQQDFVAHFIDATPRAWTHWLLLYRALAADVIYVDNSNSCTGDDGSSGEPWCSITAAFADPVLGAGDVIKIRTGSGPYEEVATISDSGASGSPIIIEPDTANTPTLRCTTTTDNGVITVTNASHITIRNLTFSATGLSSPCLNAVRVRASTANVIGVTITSNAFVNWGGNNAAYNPASTGYQTVRLGGTISGQTPVWTVTATISNNTFSGSVYTDIRVATGLNTIVEKNTISGTRCGHFQDARTGMQPIKDSIESVGTIIRKNYIHDLAQDCGSLAGVGADENIQSGIYCDAGAENGIIEDNLIHDIDYPTPFNNPVVGEGEESVGIFIESRCHGWIVRRNVVYNIGRRGLRQGSVSTGDPNDSQYIHNTFFNIGEQGAQLVRGFRTILKNNIFLVKSGGDAAMETETNFVASGPHEFDGNVYLIAGSSNVGRWGDSTNRTLATWKSTLAASGQLTAAYDDDDSLNCDPSLSATGTIQSLSSCAVDAGITVAGYAKNGALPTIGALDPVRFSVGECGLVDALSCILTWTNNVAPPLLPITGITGITINQDTGGGFGSDLESTTIRQGTNQTDSTVSAITGGAALRFSYTPGNLTDSALVGNILNQPVLVIVNQTSGFVNNVGGGAPTYVLTQTNCRSYRVPFVNFALDPYRSLNATSQVIKGGTVIVVCQVDNTIADAPAIGMKWQHNRNGAGLVDVLDTLDTGIRFAGSDFSGSQYPQQGFVLSNCLAGALTCISGSLQRTSLAIPNVDMTQDSSVPIGGMFTIDITSTPGTIHELCLANQDGTPLNGTCVPAVIEVIDYNFGGVFR